MDEGDWMHHRERHRTGVRGLSCECEPAAVPYAGLGDDPIRSMYPDLPGT
jgi:hypothetical protein